MICLGTTPSPEARQSAVFLLQFNIRTITVLLEKFLPELDDASIGEDLPDNSSGARTRRSRERITVISRKILPALRQYSTWLVSRITDIVKEANDAHPRELTMYIRQMWAVYARVMTKIVGVFPVEELEHVGYLLEEDEMTVGFKPLRDPNLETETNLYVNADGNIKPRITDPGIARSLPKVEMTARIQDILLCALVLFTKTPAPITLEDGEFIFVEASHSSPVPNHSHGNSSPQMALDHSCHKATPTFDGRDFVPTPASANVHSAQYSMDTDMNRMVDNLVEPSSGKHSDSNETSYGMHSLTADEIFAPIGHMNNGTHYSPHNSQEMLPSLPGIWKSAFTPQPHELQQSNPDRPSLARPLLPLQYSTSQQQIAAASTLEEITGYCGSGKSPWGRSSNPASKPIIRTDQQSLQNSLSQHYMPSTMGSSQFPDSSSIYANTTPRTENRYRGGGLSGYSHAINNSTVYPGASDYDTTTMLRSSLWDGNQPLHRDYVQTPPGGQGG